jgi:hypothetical protein
MAIANVASAVTMLSPVAVGSSQGDQFFMVASSPNSGSGVTGLIEFSLAGLEPVSSALLSFTADRYQIGSWAFNEGFVVLNAFFYEGNGVIDNVDQSDPARRINPFQVFTVSSVTTPSYLDVTSKFNEAVARHCTHLGIGFTVDLQSPDSYVRVFGPGQGAGDEILENNFSLWLVPEPGSMAMVLLALMSTMTRPWFSRDLRTAR